MNETMLSEVIYKGIENEVRKIIEEEAKCAGERVEERVRGMVGQVATKVLERCSFEVYGSTLKILVDFKNVED